MIAVFKDHFSGHASKYAAFRPVYPRALVDFLADLAPATEVALDVGCGTGQLSTLLTARFGRVVATDASAKQIAEAEPADRVEYRVAPCEASGLPDASVDLLTVAQAAHWFDLDRFYAEARRVLRPGGVLALICYMHPDVTGPVRDVFLHFYEPVCGPYWPPERRMIEDGYRSLAFPFEELPAPTMDLVADWTLDDLLGYVDTWSAVRALEKARGREPYERFVEAMYSADPDPARRRRVSWPLAMRVGRKRAAG